MTRVALFFALLAVSSLACSVSTVTPPTPTAILNAPERTQTPANTPDTPKPPHTMTVTAPLNLRACVGTGCAVLAVLPAGETVTTFGGYIAADGGQWVKVTTGNGMIGYVNIDYLAAK